MFPFAYKSLDYMQRSMFPYLRENFFHHLFLRNQFSYIIMYFKKYMKKSSFLNFFYFFSLEFTVKECPPYPWEVESL